MKVLLHTRTFANSHLKKSWENTESFTLIKPHIIHFSIPLLRIFRYYCIGFKLYLMSLSTHKAVLKWLPSPLVENK